jgi:hypothetical protein
MNLTDDQVQELKRNFTVAYEYAQMAKNHNSDKTEIMKNLLEDLCPKPSGKMSVADRDRERYREEKAKAKQFINDSYRLFVRDIEQVEDTTPEALILSERFRK